MSNNLPSDKNKNQEIQVLELNAKMVERLSALEQQKLDLENKRIDFAKQQDFNGYQYSLKALETKHQDQKLDKEMTERFLTKLFWFIGFGLLLITILIIVSFHYNKEQFIYECLKVIIPLVIGWVGGDAYRSKRIEKQ